MAAARDGKMWRCQFYYKDWQGVSHKKNKRGLDIRGKQELGSYRSVKGRLKDGSLEKKMENCAAVHLDYDYH